MYSVNTAHRLAQDLRANLEKVIFGKSSELLIPIAAILGGGHILCADVPGVGKTILSRALAKSLGCSFARLQCTADILPSDIIGVTIYNQKNSEFEFKTGPIFNQIFLADEINRATPKAQSALLECMAEQQVTVSGKCYHMASPFLVLATQNPIEYEGTFPLPEAQLDRFMVSLSLGYPNAEAECYMLSQQRLNHPIGDISQIATAEELIKAQEEVRGVTVSDDIVSYIVDLINFTRQSSELLLGASPRGSQALYRASQAWAAMEGRTFVVPDDVQALISCTLRHRLLPRHRHDMQQSQRVIDEALRTVPVPVS